MVLRPKTASHEVKVSIDCMCSDHLPYSQYFSQGSNFRGFRGQAQQLSPHGVFIWRGSRSKLQIISVIQVRALP